MAMGRHTVYRSNNVTVDFEMDRDGIAECAVGPELRVACHEIAEKGKAFAIAISPVGFEDLDRDDQVHYINSFELDDTHVVLGAIDYPMRRVATRLWNLAPHAAAVEWGNRYNPDGYYILSNTVERLERL